MKKIIKYIKNMFKKDKTDDISKSDLNIVSDGIGSGKNLSINLKRMGYSYEEINKIVYPSFLKDEENISMKNKELYINSEKIK